MSAVHPLHYATYGREKGQWGPKVNFDWNTVRGATAPVSISNKSCFIGCIKGRLCRDKILSHILNTQSNGRVTLLTHLFHSGFKSKSRACLTACYLSFLFVLQEYPTLTTFFVGEIISRKRPFLTRKWDADEDVDRKHWV